MKKMFLFSEEPFSWCLLCSCLGNRNSNDEDVEGFAYRVKKVTNESSIKRKVPNVNNTSLNVAIMHSA